MIKNRLRIDKVRASRDGHEFHEAWAARKALQLVLPTDGLVGIAVEGLTPKDQTKASAETVEIADLTLYYGNDHTFSSASSIVIIQLKYSISSESIPFRASDAKKTIIKFAKAFKDHKHKQGAKDTRKKLFFELITNRPIAHEFHEAIDRLATRTTLKGNAKKQATQFVSACGFKDKELVEFAQKIRVTGLAGSLRQNKQHLSSVIADWSAAPDVMARARLGNLKQLLRDKAGSTGEGQNVITQTDVLDALELQSPEDLFPCPASFPKVGKIVEREQLPTLINKIPKLSKPLIIHADGGVGKTVVLQSLAAILGETHETILFDCFGGGAYRAPEDARHLPKRGLVHIINSLACKGLCDPLLPNSEYMEDIVKAFRTRLSQSVATLQRGSKGKQLLLFIDAIDNAAEHAKDKGESAFPSLLLESLYHKGAVEGVQLVVSCRTYRRVISRGNLPREACEEIQLDPFSPAETERYLRDRLPNVTDTQIQVAYSRSEGNPRILEHLAVSEGGLLEPSEINSVIKLDDLLMERIRKALSDALKRGYKERSINVFLAGLSVLPPPVPLAEYADAHGIDLSTVKSFAADLAPLLEQTRHGLMFRDEPTETLVRRKYAANAHTLRTLAQNLFKKQETSVYAASALPGLLQQLDDGKLLFKLAFDERFPSAITSTVGKQNIRYARLKAAVLHAARTENSDHLVRLLVELSTLAAVNQRGTEYIVGNPDLVVASQDVDATRRLFETPTHWPGTRHARLTIASVLSGDVSNASRHVLSAAEWIRHFFSQGEEYRRDKGGPSSLDIASLPLHLIAQDQGGDAAQLLNEWKGVKWKDWYAYEISEHLFKLLRQSERMGTLSTANVRRFLNSIDSQPAVLAAALSFMEFDNATRRRLIRKLANACEKKAPLEKNQSFHSERNHLIQEGFLKAAAAAIQMKMPAEMLVITKVIPQEKLGFWSFNHPTLDKEAFYFIVRTALRLASKQLPFTEQALLPQALADLGRRVPVSKKGEAFRKLLKAKLEECFKSQQELPAEKRQISDETKRDAERFIAERLEPLHKMAQTFTTIFSSAPGKGDSPFLELVDVWAKYREKPEGYYSYAHETTWFFDVLGRQLLTFCLWTRNDLKASSAEAFVTKMSEFNTTPSSTIVKVIAALAKRPDLQELAGKMAMGAKALIEHEDDVDSRASLFAQLSRAIMPASIEETTSYFRLGLEQMDAIGSGDYPFTSGLLHYAAQLRGEELEERDFHTLSNICELNNYESDKFPWLEFARGLARTSGCRTLAKLGRWDDREKSSLDYSLLPYLVALLEQDKIDPAIALGILRLSSPVEFYYCGTAQLAEIIAKKRYPNTKALLTELILQFQQNHPGVYMPSTQSTLHKIAEREFGKGSELTTYLSIAAQKFEKLQDQENENRNYRGKQYLRSTKAVNNQQKKALRAVKKLEDETNPTDEASMSRAVEQLKNLGHFFDLRTVFFNSLREKLKYTDRPRYIQVISRLEALDIYAKLDELKECKRRWGASSVALQQLFSDVAKPLIQIHADDFVSYAYLSSSKLKDIAELSGIPTSSLALELITIFASPNSHLPASVWIGLAAAICEKTNQSEGQIALKRLLNSNAGMLASTVPDGDWKEGIYPKGEPVQIAAGLVWRVLGAPSAAHRWRGAHSLRCFARFGKWEVIDTIIDKFHCIDAHPYQAPELPFYFLHARLWLLIAIARMAKDYPQKVARYADMLKTIALDTKLPHVLLRHFATQALLTCASRGSLTLSKSEGEALKGVNKSPFPIKKTKEFEKYSFYQARPDSIPEPVREFHLDYDFDKYKVTKLSNLFGRSGWETKNAITAWVRKYDPQITRMRENGRRSVSQRDELRGMTDHYHRYGEQLGWHALYFIAGEFLAKYPVIQRPYDDPHPWHEWLKRNSLTREDGFWLSDGTDRPPLDTQLNLYEEKKGLVLTGNKAKLLSLLNIESFIDEEVVVAGNWLSNDGIKIHITSALAPSSNARKLALELSKTSPFRAWLPHAEELDSEDENSLSEKTLYTPWIVWPYTELGLDETDPLCVATAVRRLYFTKAISSLKPLDEFKRTWKDSKGRVAARSEAWIQTPKRREEAISGERLVCRSSFLKDVLKKQNANLLVLIELSRYGQGFADRADQWWRTTAIIRIEALWELPDKPQYLVILERG